MGTGKERPAGQPWPDMGVCNAATHTLQTGERKTKARAFNLLTCLTTTIASTLLGVSISLVHSDLALIDLMTMRDGLNAKIPTKIKPTVIERV